MAFDLLTVTRTYRSLLDAEDRTMAVGPTFLLLDGRVQPKLTTVSNAVAIAMAMRDLNAGVNTALRFAPPRPEVVEEAPEVAEPTPALAPSFQ